MNHLAGLSLVGSSNAPASSRRASSSVRFRGGMETSAPETTRDSFHRSGPQPPRILLVEDNEDLIELLRDVAEMGDFELVGVATNYADAIRSFGEQQPDIVLLDKNIIGTKTGVDIHHTLRDEFGFPEKRMIFTSSEDIPGPVRGESPQIEKAAIAELSGEHPLVADALK